MPRMPARPGTRSLLRALGRRLPRTRGELRVAGLHDEVVVRRDRWGIPHVDAAGDADAWFALGFCHGQDRAFQLELIARAGRGLLAELLGAAALPIDRLSRTLGFRRVALEQVGRLDPDVLATLEAYVAGINAAAGCTPRPHELVLLRAERSAWTVEDVLAFGGLQSLALGGSWDSELARQAILDADGPAAAGRGRTDLRAVAAGRDAARRARRRTGGEAGGRPFAPPRPGRRVGRLERVGRRRIADGVGRPDPRQRPAPRTGHPAAVVPRASAHPGVGAGRRLVRRRRGVPDRLQWPRRVGHHRRLHRLGRPVLGGALRRRRHRARARWSGARRADRRDDPGTWGRHASSRRCSSPGAGRS